MSDLNGFLNKNPNMQIPLTPAHFSKINTCGLEGLSENERNIYFMQSTTEEYSTEDPSQELTKKFKEWTYGGSPYLFGYYATEVPDFITIYRPNGTVTELGYSVKKIFKEVSVKHLVEIYKTLRENKVRYNDKLEHSTSHCVYLAPCELQRTPTNLKELLQALICILTCLKEMHGIKPNPLMHRDVRWPNIVRYKDEYKKFILIDFDYATFGKGKKGIAKKL
ncbi:11561_t:CDS:2 [Ambispora gerdemannii]|uniref:11561_t:CDS:1 n=1 Tax=Ambispora gerdemannii TaxID=144530 RepID=A0A9N8YQL0_9GLOM|nr:11561_t:CDS:2 [Ambispora gerdemannii]